MQSFSRASVVLACAAALLVIGCAVRFAALSSTARTIAAISEDGYLMLTVARNVALGRSLTIADGTIATNGVQPLVTFAWAGVHWVARAERMPSLRIIVLLQWTVAVLTAELVRRLTRDALRRHPWRDAGAIFAASLWFASPLALRHTTNGLETGPAVCILASILLLDLRWRERSRARAAVIGALLGVLFLARNDAVFFILVFGLAELWDSRSGVRRRIEHTAMMAVATLAVAAPWLVYNARTFGSIVPVSGRAQNLNIGVGESLIAVPRVLAEYAWMVTPLPAALGERPFWGLLTIAVLVGALILTVRRCGSVGVSLDRWMMLLLVHTGLLTAYYGVFFGAAYFLSRYLFPVSLVAVLVPMVWLLPNATQGRVIRGAAWRPPVVAVALMALVGVSAWRLYARSAVQDHFQVVQWVSDHVSPETWVGAPQSGTLGYFHDRTINLDGKVNPLALDARRENRLFQ
jgi:hypothetical protein